MESQTYWNEIGAEKNFEDPFYLEKLEPFIEKDSKIIEYGCGYGRLLNVLDEAGYRNLCGFDFAQRMIGRGKQCHPHLRLEVIEESGKVPLEGGSCDAIIMSTILCCIPDQEEQVGIIGEMRRLLCCGGVLYLSDFMVSNHPRYTERYEGGVYRTNEGLTVRHHTTQWVMDLLREFDVQWFEQFDFKTMNNNFARTFHCIARGQA